MNEKYKILLVEDTESTLTAFSDHLSSDFDVSCSQSFLSAKKTIEEKKKNGLFFDLVISRMHLPDGSAFSLADYCKEHSSETTIILITSYDVNDYIESIYDAGISHIISKQSILSLKYIHTMSKKILTSDIFGIQKYFSDIKIYYPTESPTNRYPKNKEVFSVVVRSPEERVYWIDKIADIFDETMNISKSYSKLILEEITINALIKAPRHDDQTYKFQEKVDGIDRLIPKEDIELDEEDYFIVQYGFHEDFMILLCQDNYGTLRKKEVLYRLKRHITVHPQTGLPRGLYDSHGRGFFLLREKLTHLVINIKRNHKTEVICLYSKKYDTVYKNISIYEIS